MFKNSFNTFKNSLFHEKISILLIILIGINGCKKSLFIKDISDKQVVLVSPGNGASLKSQTVTFIWEELEDATSYRFRLATPQFDSIKLLLIDSLSIINSISFTLTPGVYEWQIRGENDGYESPYSTYKINIDSTTSLDGFQLVLSSPKDSFYTNSSSPNFSWKKLQIANEYNFKIVEGIDFENGNLFTSNVSTSENKLTISKSLENGKYIWGVNAENDVSKTSYTTRFLQYDDISPINTQLKTPSNGEKKFTGKVSFTWSSTSDNGSPITDSIFIASDNLFSNLKVSSIVNGGVYQDSLSLGTYYWRMSSTDRAGNWSGYSNTFNFTIQ